jgi:hypothetical protein
MEYGHRTVTRGGVMPEGDPDPKKNEQFLRAAGQKPPFYGELIDALKEAKVIAHKRSIPDWQVRGAIREVFGEEEQPT